MPLLDDEKREIARAYRAYLSEWYKYGEQYAGQNTAIDQWYAYTRALINSRSPQEQAIIVQEIDTIINSIYQIYQVESLRAKGYPPPNVPSPSGTSSMSLSELFKGSNDLMQRLGNLDDDSTRQALNIWLAQKGYQNVGINFNKEKIQVTANNAFLAQEVIGNIQHDLESLVQQAELQHSQTREQKTPPPAHKPEPPLALIDGESIDVALSRMQLFKGGMSLDAKAIENVPREQIGESINIGENIRDIQERLDKIKVWRQQPNLLQEHHENLDLLEKDLTELNDFFTEIKKLREERKNLEKELSEPAGDSSEFLAEEKRLKEQLEKLRQEMEKSARRAIEKPEQRSKPPVTSQFESFKSVLSDAASKKGKDKEEKKDTESEKKRGPSQTS